MRLDVISDIHLEFFGDQGADFVASWIPTAPVLVLAGDVGDARWWREGLRHLQTLCEHYEQVLFVAGNHDYYGTYLEDTDARLRRVEEQIENFRWLEQEKIEIDGVKFAGCTLWFKEDPAGQIYEKWMNDFNLIEGLRHEDNPLTRYFLCAVDDVILDLQPKLWVHGHTHVPCDYRLWDTRVVCNPKGYPEERGLDRPYGPVTVEI